MKAATIKIRTHRNSEVIVSQCGSLVTIEVLTNEEPVQKRPKFDRTVFRGAVVFPCKGYIPTKKKAKR